MPIHHLHLYAFPQATRIGPLLQLAGHTCPTLMCDEAEVAATALDVSFEVAVERLQRLKRLFIELDGAFVWTGVEHNRAWQLDGMLYDHADRMRRIEIKGWCPEVAWREWLRCFNWPTGPLLAHSIDWKCFLGVSELIDSGLWSDCPRG